MRSMTTRKKPKMSGAAAGRHNQADRREENPGQKSQHEIKIAPVYLPISSSPKANRRIDPESRFAYLNVGAAEGVKPS